MRIKEKISGIFAIAAFLALFSSCQKDINIALPQAVDKVVIEGSIDLNDYPIVIVTRNLPYFGTIDSTMIYNLFIQDAVVIVSDGMMNDTLHKTYDFNAYPQIYFKGTKIKGEVGKTYFLTVNAEGKTFTSTTTIPATVTLDSLWFKLEPNKDSLGYIWSKFTDPPEQGNYYRLYTKRINKDKTFVPMLYSSVYSDNLFNGQSFTFSIERGTSSFNSITEDPDLGYFKIGDTTVIKACTIDKASYDFWRSAESEIYGGGNPFMNPTQIKSNIEGGGLGGWCGYGCLYDTVIAK